jgi:CheY-like chemotaxis protein
MSYGAASKGAVSNEADRQVRTCDQGAVGRRHSAPCCDAAEIVDLARTLEGLQILLLEDEALIALDVEQLCREHGAAQVRVARTLDAAATAFSIGFDAAILDLMLGSQPTTDLAKQLVERGIPFIFATGHVAQDTLLAPFAGVPVVGKPYFGAGLIDALAQAIRSKRGSHDGD